MIVQCIMHFKSGTGPFNMKHVTLSDHSNLSTISCKDIFTLQRLKKLLIEHQYRKIILIRIYPQPSDKGGEQ